MTETAQKYFDSSIADAAKKGIILESSQAEIIRDQSIRLASLVDNATAADMTIEEYLLSGGEY